MLTFFPGAQAPALRHGERGLVFPFARPCARRTNQDGERKRLLCGPGTVRSGRAGPSGANGVGRHLRSLRIPSWGVSIFRRWVMANQTVFR
jgi:hypothetical protein